MKLKLSATFIILFVLAISTADAQYRQNMQRHRINDGIRSGELTRGEARNLRMREFRTQRHVRRAHRDGVITGRERKEIRREKRMNSRAIHRMKHNRRHRI